MEREKPWRDCVTGNLSELVAREAGLSPQQLMLEITEGEAVQYAPSARIPALTGAPRRDNIR
jgi:hypothetical protein